MMSRDQARTAVATVIIQAIPDSSAEMIAEWTAAQWRGFIVGMQAAGPLMWGAVERGDLAGVYQASAYGDQIGDVARFVPEALGLPPDPPTPAELAAVADLELALAQERAFAQPDPSPFDRCPACGGCGVVPCPSAGG